VLPRHPFGDWPQLYGQLYAMKPTPIVALNRAVAMSKARGLEEALAQLNAIPDSAKLKDYPFSPAPPTAERADIPFLRPQITIVSGRVWAHA